MLTVVLSDSYVKAKAQIMRSAYLAEAYEFRLDTFKDITPAVIAHLMGLLDHETIFTYRMAQEGGLFHGVYEARWNLLKSYLSLAPSYVDLEAETPAIYINLLRQNYPHIKLILSRHYLNSTPLALEAEVDEMLQKKADVYKIATYAQSTLDSLKMLHISKRCKDAKIPFVGICMGEKGLLTRLLSSVMGHMFTYCSSDAASVVAPGQICIEDLHQIYRYKRLNTSTKIYALLGHPVKQSPSHYTHNQVFDQLGMNALYVKIDVDPEELSAVFQACKQLPFEGFSVTVPFKEQALELVGMLDESAQKIGAINTLYQREGEWRAANTDWQGAIRALQEHICLQDQKCLILGAGGTAKAIAYGVLKEGAFVTVLNRTQERALNLAEQLGCVGMGFEQLEEPLCYDVVIHTTTVKHVLPLEKKHLLNHRVVMDVLLHPVETPLLCLAKQQGCRVIYGYTMFLYQAAEQFRYWTNAPLEGIEELLKQAYFDFSAIVDGCCSSRNL
jgi:3-dehydroquinate dehydratase / shikimate dehydrogenase